MTTDQMLEVLQDGQRAVVTNHIGYKSYLTKVNGELRFKLDPSPHNPRGYENGYDSYFHIDPDDWNVLKWQIQ